jgi:hypothetical protein
MGRVHEIAAARRREIEVRRAAGTAGAEGGPT